MKQWAGTLEKILHAIPCAVRSHRKATYNDKSSFSEERVMREECLVPSGTSEL